MPTPLSPSGRSTLMNFKIPGSQRRELIAAAQQSGETISEFLRTAALARAAGVLDKAP